MKKLLSRKIKLIRKFLKRYGKRLVSIVLLSSLLITCVSAGFFTKKEKEVKAFGGVVEYAYGHLFQMIAMMASFSGGGSTSEVIQSKESAGITDMDSSLNYVKESTTNNSNFMKMFSFDSISQQVQFQTCLAKTYLMGSYVLNKKWMNDVWNQWVDGSAAIKIDEHLSDIPAEVIQFPSPDNNDDNEETSEPSLDSNDSSNKIVFPTQSIPYIIGSSTFSAIFSLVRSLKCEDAENKFGEKESKNKDVCDYSKSYWSSHSDILTLDSQCIKDEQTGLLKFQFNEAALSSCDKLYSSDKIYPLIYKNDGKVFFCYSFSKEIPSSFVSA